MGIRESDWTEYAICPFIFRRRINVGIFAKCFTIPPTKEEDFPSMLVAEYLLNALGPFAPVDQLSVSGS